jgi:hypothetical protein
VCVRDCMRFYHSHRPGRVGSARSSTLHGLFSLALVSRIAAPKEGRGRGLGVEVGAEEVARRALTAFLERLG